MKKIFVIIFILLFVNFSFCQDKEWGFSSDFSVNDISGKKVTLSNFIEKGPVLLHFWATWCKPCLEEMPHLSGIYEKYKDKGFTLIAVSTDDARTANKVKTYIRGRKYNFPVIIDSEQDIQNAYRVQDVMPSDFLINKKGKIVYSHIGYKSGEEAEMEEKILELLGEN